MTISLPQYKLEDKVRHEDGWTGIIREVQEQTPETTCNAYVVESDNGPVRNVDRASYLALERELTRVEGY